MHDAFGNIRAARRVHRIPPAQGRDAPLSLQEVAPAGGTIKATPVVLLHGATYGSAMFDIPVPGYSFQGFLAASGWRTFALDVRGYGRSLPSAILDAPPQDNAPYARLADAVDDLASAVRFVLAGTGRTSAHVVSFSWGTVIAGMFAARHPELVDRLVLYAPLYGEVNELWIDRIADREDRTRVSSGLGAYRWIGLSDVRSRWDADIPESAAPGDYREERVLDAVFEALVAADPQGRTRGVPAFRAPAGALVDLFQIFSGHPLFDPAGIAAPTLLVRGQDDTTSTESDSLRLLGELGTSRKRYVAIAPGSHFLCAERNATELFGEIDLFLSQ